MTSVTIRTAIALFAAGAVAVAAAGTAATQVSAQPGVTAVYDLSAKDNDNDKKKKKKANQPQKNGVQNRGTQGVQQNNQFGGQKRDSQQPKFSGQQNGNQSLKSSSTKSGGSNKKVKVYKFKGPNATIVVGRNLRGAPKGTSGAFVLRGKNYTVWRGGGYRIRYRDRWRTFVPLSALAVLLVGQRHYYPYAYVSASRYFCEGLTEDGCVLNWDEVETIDGDLIGQCVAFCPWEEY